MAYEILSHKDLNVSEKTKIDLINKGLMKADTWEQIDSLVLKLQDATALQT